MKRGWKAAICRARSWKKAATFSSSKAAALSALARRRAPIRPSP